MRQGQILGPDKVSIQMTVASVAANLKQWIGSTSPAVAAVG